MGQIGADIVPVNRWNIDPLQVKSKQLSIAAARNLSNERTSPVSDVGDPADLRGRMLVGGGVVARSVLSSYQQTRVCAYYEQLGFLFRAEAVKLVDARKCWMPNQPKKDRMTSIAFSVEDSAAEVNYRGSEASRRIFSGTPGTVVML